MAEEFTKKEGEFDGGRGKMRRGDELFKKSNKRQFQKA